MNARPFRIRAVFSDGAFRPLEPVDLPDSQIVELNVAPSGWAERLEALLAKFRERAPDVSEEELDRDISEAFADARAERYRPR